MKNIYEHFKSNPPVDANGKPCLGFSESRREAMNFCYELVLEADTSSLEKEQA